MSKKRNPRRTKLESIETDIKARFDEYEAAVINNSLDEIAEDPIFRPHSVDLQHCYGGKTSKLLEMLRGICDAQDPGALKWCPYCGLTSPGSYDHYLPKELFPEFSANPQNLISSCTTCNSSKGKRWLDAGIRLFIHFYSDQIPDDVFLSVDLQHNNGAFCASFRITKPAATDPAIWAVIENHFRELSLLDKYRENTNDEIVSVTNSCVAHLRNGGSSISLFLEDIAIEDVKTFGENHWRIVLMRSLAQNKEFEDVVNSKV